jgi:hypothetical protein
MTSSDIRLPVVLLSAEQCEAQAEEMLDALSVCADPEMRDWLRSEAREWQTLAAQRAGGVDG